MARFPRLTLQSLLKSEKNKSLRLTTQQRFLISLRLLENLQDIHQQNIVHLDLQPSNIMVDLSSAETYIIDIASAVDNGEDFQNSRGHELYMSAEGLNKTVANASFKMDIYSISVILGAIWRCEDGYLINKNKGELEEKHHNKLPRFTAFFEGIKDLSKNEQQAIIEILNNGTAFDPEQRQDVTASLEIFAKLYATWKPSQTAISFLQDLPAQLDSLLAGNIMQSLKETLLNRIENVSKEVEVVKKRFVGVENSLGNNIFSFFGKNKRTEPVLAPLVTTPSSVPANNGL
jgi:serine/threonine protein kinase